MLCVSSMGEKEAPPLGRDEGEGSWLEDGIGDTMESGCGLTEIFFLAYGQTESRGQELGWAGQALGLLFVDETSRQTIYMSVKVR